MNLVNKEMLNAILKIKNSVHSSSGAFKEDAIARKKKGITYHLVLLGELSCDEFIDLASFEKMKSDVILLCKMQEWHNEESVALAKDIDKACINAIDQIKKSDAIATLSSAVLHQIEILNSKNPDCNIKALETALTDFNQIITFSQSEDSLHEKVSSMISALKMVDLENGMLTLRQVDVDDATDDEFESAEAELSNAAQDLENAICFSIDRAERASREIEAFKCDFAIDNGFSNAKPVLESSELA